MTMSYITYEVVLWMWQFIQSVSHWFIIDW